MACSDRRFGMLFSFVTVVTGSFPLLRWFEYRIPETDNLIRIHLHDYSRKIEAPNMLLYSKTFRVSRPLDLCVAVFLVPTCLTFQRDATTTLSQVFPPLGCRSYGTGRGRIHAVLWRQGSCLCPRCRLSCCYVSCRMRCALHRTLVSCTFMYRSALSGTTMMLQFHIFLHSGKEKWNRMLFHKWDFEKCSSFIGAIQFPSLQMTKWLTN